MELIIRNGQTFWVPVTETVSINCFSKWEQAFNIFANIYTSKYPQRSSELIQYNHIINSVSGTYTWENIYAYDREFRLHISRHPECSWSVILQQAWAMKLRDCIFRSEATGSLPNNSNNNSPGRMFSTGGPGGNQYMPKAKINEPCHRYNHGRCKFGAGCKYEHKCSYCNKF